MGGLVMARRHFRRVDEPLDKPYHYTECGLDDVFLLNGYERVKTEYGTGISIPDEDAENIATVGDAVEYLQGKVS
jgi:hypothetical protein